MNMMRSPSFSRKVASLTRGDEGVRQLLLDISMCGSRGLDTLSLAECRHITDEGVIRLVRCQYLRKLCLLGCANLKDDGVQKLASDLNYLEELDIGSTNITGETLRKLVVFCKHLKKVNVMSCKRLNASDDIVLKQHGITVESGEDIFRFHLVPEFHADLPKITTSVLKTRSTLSLHKVYKYLLKKLEENNVDELTVCDPNQVVTAVVISCDGKELDQSLQLRAVKDLYWPTDERLLTLHYKRRDTLISQKNKKGAKPEPLIK